MKIPFVKCGTSWKGKNFGTDKLTLNFGRGYGNTPSKFPEKDKEGEELFCQGIKLERQDKKDEAKELFQKAFKSNPRLKVDQEYIRDVINRNNLGVDRNDPQTWNSQYWITGTLQLSLIIDNQELAWDSLGTTSHQDWLRGRIARMRNCTKRLPQQ